MNTFIQLLKALAAFAWPTLITFTIWKFHNEIRTLLSALPDALKRVTGADVLGVKVELQELRDSSAQAQSEALEEGLGRPVQEPKVPNTNGPTEVQADPIASIRSEASLSPQSALILTAAFIERELRFILAVNGLLLSFASPVQGAALLVQNKLITTSLFEAIDSFFSVRNVAAHIPNTKIAAEVIESGIRILTVLRAVPRSTHEVVATDIPLFDDPLAQSPVQNAKGVMLRARDQYGRPSQMVQIFPTTREFRVGTAVTWEWNMARSWSDTWFRDPASGEIRSAWGSSAEFVGRDVNTL